MTTYTVKYYHDTIKRGVVEQCCAAQFQLDSDLPIGSELYKLAHETFDHLVYPRGCLMNIRELIFPWATFASAMH